MSLHSIPRLFIAALVASVLLNPRAVAKAPEGASPSLDERIVLVAPSGESAEDREIARWQDRVRAAETEHRAVAGNYERLGWAYISKARRTLDSGYYKLAEKTADVMDARFGPSDEALLLRGHVYHNLHRFSEAEAVARDLVARRGIAFDFALLSDALMEQGKIAESVEACQRMMALRPGVDAYSRAANLRWLTGDLDGAVSAMEAAVRAGSPLDGTNTAWTLTRLSSYYLQQGKTRYALAAAARAEELAPGYPPALLARGRAWLALGEPGRAKEPIAEAARLNPLPEYEWWLADTLRASGDPVGAAKVEAELESRGEVSDPRTYSLYLSTRGKRADDAVRMATDELSRRADVLTRDALAWALESRGDFSGAEAAIQPALAAKTEDARLFLHAGEIARNLGRQDEADRYFDQAQRFSGTLTPSEKTLLDARLKPHDRATAQSS